jgi:nucleotide-binding universal stress UspA family protein
LNLQSGYSSESSITASSSLNCLQSNPQRKSGAFMTSIHKASFSATEILVPIDFSASSEAALEAATGLAKQFHAGIHLVHVIPEFPDVHGDDLLPETADLEERRQSVQLKLNAWKEQLERQGVRTTYTIERGNDIVGNLILAVEHQKADMIVISTHGLSGWRPLILGSIAEQVIKQVDCTLVLIRSSRKVSNPEEPPIDVCEDTFVSPAVGANHLRLSCPTPETIAQKRMDRPAEELAERGQRTEQQYDESHSIFTK